MTRFTPTDTFDTSDDVSFRGWPTDADGNLLPAVPIRGLRLDAYWGDHVACFTRWRVSASSAAGFTVESAGRLEQHPASAWVDWLDARVAEGRVWAHLPGCQISWCRGCDTSGVGRPELPTPVPGSLGRAPTNHAPPVRSPSPRAFSPVNGAHMTPTNVAGRDARVLRAAQDVLKKYTFTPSDASDLPASRRRYTVTGGDRPYVVVVDVEWSADPACTCPDHLRKSNGAFCKHVIGALLRDDALRCQLLELFL